MKDIITLYNRMNCCSVCERLFKLKLSPFERVPVFLLKLPSVNELVGTCSLVWSVQIVVYTFKKLASGLTLLLPVFSRNISEYFKSGSHRAFVVQYSWHNTGEKIRRWYFNLLHKRNCLGGY